MWINISFTNLRQSIGVTVLVLLQKVPEDRFGLDFAKKIIRSTNNLGAC